MLTRQFPDGWSGVNHADVRRSSHRAPVLTCNKALLRRYKTGILDSRDLDALAGGGGRLHRSRRPFLGQAPGLAGLRQRVATLFEALDPRWTIDNIVAGGDRVVLRWHLIGRHVGNFLRFPATGTPCVMRGIDMYRVGDGWMRDHWNVIDMFGFVQQDELLR